MENLLKKIFIADDDESIVDVISLMLEKNGYEASCTMAGQSVARYAQQEQPDLLLLDIWMSDADGRDICRQMKSNPATRDIPVLMFSASKDAKQSAFESGADDFLEKPFDMKVFITKIKNLLADHKFKLKKA